MTGAGLCLPSSGSPSLPPIPISKKIGRRSAGLRNGGLNLTRKTLARSVHTPGGWGAEESGVQYGPGPEATVFFLAIQLGVWWAELGPHYDSLNESVIPAGLNAAPRR